MKEDYFPFYSFRGSHQAIGQQFGETCRDLIRHHYDLVHARLNKRRPLSIDDISALALQFRPYVLRDAPFLDEEIQGMAQGAGLSLGQAYSLQLRAELAVLFGNLDIESNECTTFGVLPTVTASQNVLAGQNADLPAFYTELGVVVEIIPDHGIPVLMLTVAGQVSYIGMNREGLCGFGNYLVCDGWRVGFPRYLLTRLAMTQTNVPDAVQLIESVERASSRNLLMADLHGHATTVETIPLRTGRVDAHEGIVVHANHFIAPELLDEERAEANELHNSQRRQQRMEELLHENRGKITADLMQTVMRDRACYPDALSRELGDDKSDVITFASYIAELNAREAWIAKGPPHQYLYRRYAFSV